MLEFSALDHHDTYDLGNAIHQLLLQFRQLDTANLSSFLAYSWKRKKNTQFRRPNRSPGEAASQTPAPGYIVEIINIS